MQRLSFLNSWRQSSDSKESRSSVKKTPDIPKDDMTASRMSLPDPNKDAAHTNLGKILSSYYDDVDKVDDTQAPLMREETIDLDPEQGLEGVLSRWQKAINDESALKNEVKGLLYENCDKFFQCISLITRLSTDIKDMQAKRVSEVSAHIADLSLKHRKRDSDHQASLQGSESEQTSNSLRNMETTVISAFDSSSILDLVDVMRQSNDIEDWAGTIRLYLNFRTFLSKFRGMQLIGSLLIEAERAAIDATRNLMDRRFEACISLTGEAPLKPLLAQIDEVLLKKNDAVTEFYRPAFTESRQELITLVLNAAATLPGFGEPGQFRILNQARSAEEAAARRLLRGSFMGNDYFVDDYLKGLFETSRWFSDNLSKIEASMRTARPKPSQTGPVLGGPLLSGPPVTILDALRPFVRIYALRHMREALFKDAHEAENFARKVSHYLIFGLGENSDGLALNFLCDCAERWAANCFGRALLDFQKDDLFRDFGDPGNLALMLHSRATAASNDCKSFYVSIENAPSSAALRLTHTVLSEAKSFYFQALLGSNDPTLLNRFGPEAVALQLLRSGRLAESRGTVYRSFYAIIDGLSAFANDLPDVEATGKEVSEKLREGLISRYLKLAASRIACHAVNALKQHSSVREWADKQEREIVEIFSNISDELSKAAKPMSKNDKKATRNVNLDIMHAERLLARRMSTGAPARGEYRGFFMQFFLKGLFEELRLSVMIKSDQILAIEQELGKRVTGLIGTEAASGNTLRGMVEDLSQVSGFQYN